MSFILLISIIIYLFILYYIIYFQSSKQNMWLVVCFTIDNTVFVIPDTWYNNGMSAWPKSYIINKKRMIEKKIPPNDRDFDYYRCRILAKNIGMLLFNFL